MTQKPKSAFLTLSDGKSFKGELVSPLKSPAGGEVVFNTGMTGYVESLTDPSYAGQILVFTYPLIGNYGVQVQHMESKQIQVNALVVSEASLNWSHAAADRSLIDWLRSQKVPIISGVDTRALTKHIRTRGSMMGIISHRPADASKMKFNLKNAAVNQPEVYNPQYKKRIILVDCGFKSNILRNLMNFKVQIKVVPFSYDYTKEKYDGVLISNGPGDPADYQETVKIAARALKKAKPVFGICLGSQIMGLAAGAKTYKMLFGHRGHNQPCMSPDGKCFITSQNHGYAIDEKSLPAEWRVLFRNLNDDTVEGIEHRSKPFFSVQFHPEAAPGPTDTKWLFERFYQLI
ncbi:glutamine-hydrolyzing carbamoyl-phosphate synthase small subunit [Candidatus Saccharibacteria bacterium]|nr:glutamine-hydrolyzing carbamoyl-phosphate synthase small subunit [Candidatus Saccharibacteria bacterium]